jgi:hypothetical protein
MHFGNELLGSGYFRVLVFADAEMKKPPNGWLRIFGDGDRLSTRGRAVAARIVEKAQLGRGCGSGRAASKRSSLLALNGPLSVGLLIEIVLGSLASGIEVTRLKASYPFLTEAHVQAARVYVKVHPRRGRPRRIGESNPGLPRRVTRIVKRTAAA